MRRAIVLLSAGLTILSAGGVSAQNDKPGNPILFVPDGLRARIVTPQTAPAMAEVRDKGVNFKNPHSLFPTFTMANGSAMATGHYLGDTGTFSNTIYTAYPVAHANDTVTPFLEVDPVLLDVDEHFGGDYLNEETILKMARDKGFSTAALGACAARPLRRTRPSWSISVPGPADATSRPIVRSKSPIRCCGKARACTAVSAAATP